jgi:AcrR family transcriptional regulator
MLASGEPKWRRRKEARPAEIVAAAFAVFSEKGFAAARLDEIAGRAGISKGALYLYFETKEDLFRAVVHEAVAPNVTVIAGFADAFEGSFADLARMLLPRAAQVIEAAGLGKIIKIVLGEGRNFPELARSWHDEVVVPALGVVRRQIERAQARGEVTPGDPRLHALSLIGPLVVGVLWKETFEPVGGQPIDLKALAAQHVETALGGLLAQRRRDVA